MEMEWVEPIVPVVDCQLDVGAMWIWDGVCLLSIHLWIERVVAHGQSGKVGRSAWLTEGAAKISV